MKLTPRHLPPLILLSATLILFHRLLLGEVIFWGTPLLQFYPWREIAFSLLRQGQLPLWNPLVGSGAPLLANYQTAVFYPPNWLYLIIPTEYAMGIVGVLHVLLAGAGMMAYLRRLGVDSTGQGVGALAFALSGYLIARFGFLSITSAVPWLPWLFWAVDGVLAPARRGADRCGAVALLGLIGGLLLLAGHAQTAFYSLLLAGCYAVWRTLSAADLLRARLTRAGLALAGVLLGAGLALIQLAPTYELMQTSQRAAGVDRELALNFSYGPARTLTLLSPNLFGSPARGDYFTPGAYWEDAAYVGLLTLALAGRAVVLWGRARRRGDVPPALRPVPFFALSLPPVFALAMGQYTPVFPFLYDHVPTFDMFQGPARWLLLAVFALSTLGGMGAADPVGRRTGRAAALLVVFGLAILSAGITACLALAEGLEPAFIRGIVRMGVVLALSGGVLLLAGYGEKLPQARAYRGPLALLLLAADLVSAHWGLNPTLPAEVYHQPGGLAADLAGEVEGYRILYTPADEDAVKFGAFLDFTDFRPGDLNRWVAMRGSLLPNLGMIDGIASIGNFDPLRVGHYDALLRSLDGLPEADLLAAAARMNVAVLLSPTERPGLEAIARTPDVIAYRLPNPWPRAALAACEDSPDGLSCTPNVESTAAIVIDEPKQVTVQVDAAAAGWLLLLDTDYPGWEAAVDGSPAPIRRANGAFRAVEVPAGQHVVEFRYRPASLRVGAAGSALSLLALAALGWGVRRPRPSHSV